MVAVRANMDMGGVARVQNLPDGASPQEPATVAQLQAAVEGLAWKDSVRVSAPASVNIASPGSTLDGVTMVVGDRALLPNQSTASQNGIYVWNGASTPMTRSLDANTADELEQAVTTVEEGTSAGASFRQTAVNFTLGTGSVAFVSFGQAAPAATTTTPGVAAFATQSEVDAGTVSNKTITPQTMAGYAGRARQAAANIGDGSATQFDVTHNFGTNDVQVEVYRTVSPFDTIVCDVSRPSTNAIRLNFAAAPTSGQFRAVVRTGGTA